MDDLVFGLQVTIVGMGIVFGLLTLLWLLLTLVLRLERRGQAGAAATTGEAAPTGGPPMGDAPGRGVLAAQPGEASPVDAPAVELVGAPVDLDPGLVAAIGVVILRHAETRRRQAAPAMRSYWPGSLLFASRWVAAGRARQARSWTRRGR
jgi:Na+-transporting methylmalonyl-CoA/oxaloacetate decarboxylase gamma subunit